MKAVHLKWSVWITILLFVLSTGNIQAQDTSGTNRTSSSKNKSAQDTTGGNSESASKNRSTQDASENNNASSANGRSAADTSGRSGASGANKQITDSGFLKNNIKQLIIGIRLAQIGEQRMERPRLKTNAREIVNNDRQVLQRLLKQAKDKDLEGVTKQELNAALGSMQKNETLSTSDPRTQATTGNTATDSLGSGSSGSGNVNGDDTGTLARTYNEDRNTNYSETGDYISDNKSILADIKALDTVKKGKSFDRQWAHLMYRLQSGKVNQYSQAANQLKDSNLRAIAVYALPRAKLDRESLYRTIRGSFGAEGLDPTQNRMGDDNINRKNAPR